MRVTLTGGGTGGHLYPGLAIIEEMNQHMTIELQFIGTRRGIENQVIRGLGCRFDTIWMSGIHRGRVAVNLLFPLKMAVSLMQALFLIGRFKPRVVIGTGGYVSWPVMTAAWLKRIPAYIQEQNQHPGLVTRKLAPLMDGVFLSFEKSIPFFKRQDHLHVCGNPTRKMFDTPSAGEAYHTLKLRADRKTLFVFGGSQGARGINEAVLNDIEQIMKIDRLQILWAAGPRWFEAIELRVRHFGDRIRVMPYIHAMDAAYAVSDLIICRAGATTVAEITRLGKAALFIPFPGAAANHQEANARALAESGAAEILLEPEIMAGDLARKIQALTSQPELCRQMARESLKQGHPDAAACIVKKILSEVNKSQGECHEISGEDSGRGK